jgi:mono/diheme cytochrome c family protein
MHMTNLAWLGALSFAVSGAALAGDAAAGQAKVEAVCAECHEKADWADQDAASLEGKIKDVVAGKAKHKKKLTLTDQEAADIAAYWAGK